MAVFRIHGSTPKKFPDSASFPTFHIEILEGNISIGSEFILWETRHQVKFTVTEIQEVPDNTAYKFIQVDTVIPWDEAWVGVVVDTDDKMRSRRGGYSV